MRTVSGNMNYIIMHFDIIFSSSSCYRIQLTLNLYKTHVNVVLQNKKKVLQSHTRKCVTRAQFD